MRFPFGFSVEVWRGPRGKYGDTNYSYHHTLDDCTTALRYSNEGDERGSRVVVGLSLYGQPGSDILADDRVRTPDGNFWRVQGEAAEWKNPFTGWEAGFEAALERVR